jgi:hypothetical protein
VVWLCDWCVLACEMWVHDNSKEKLCSCSNKSEIANVNG